ncbi:MAG: DNA-processing protein DprA, partial [Oscillospiraceae bacterium]|nr:DNA-processing protein DprA [Oscillospiraceae bacterium]
YGIKTAERFGYEIAAAGGLVVSGLAHGIDTAGARGALKAGGRVLGVLGTAIDVVYPAENRDIFRRVTERGALISEYPPGAVTRPGNFPVRNRILSGLSVGVTVIEAPEKSGALITAARALEQGRDVFAVPGNVDAPSCVGSNGLLKEGAEAVTSGLEIIAGYLPRFPDKLKNITGLSLKEVSLKASESPESRELLVADVKTRPRKKEIDKRESADYIDIAAYRRELSEKEGKVFDALTSPEMQVDDITAACGLKAGEVLSALTLLEIKGLVKQSAGKRFTLIK